MKCSYCGNELEKGADFCPGCGMILGINEPVDEPKAETAEPEFKVPEYIPNVFQAVDTEEEETAVPAMELESDEKEETVPVTENIPEYVSDIPDYENYEFEDVSSGKPVEENEPESDEKDITDTVKAADLDFSEDELTAPEYIPAPDMPSEDELDIRIPENDTIYPEYEKYKNDRAEKENDIEADEDYEEIESNDIFVESSKKNNKVLAVFLVIAVICVLVGGVYAVKNVIPAIGGKDTTTTEAQQTGDVTEDDTTDPEEDTTEAEEDTSESEENTTDGEEDTTLSGAVSEDETTDEATEDEETTAEEVTENEDLTTAPSTTVPSTTKPVTTTVPSVTKPVTTTRPSTTKPTTTDPYGINDVEVKKPAKYGKSYTLYCTAEGVILRNAPSKSSERVLYLSKGADLTVYAKENGYYYVRSNRYGVYGWVSAAYASEGRPEAETTKVYKNTVTPDKKYGDVKVKYTTNGLNLRKGPGTDYGVITLIPKNYPVKVIGYKNGVSGWVYVTDTTYGYSGWVSSAYIK
ncbi:MAG: SH3 domain-containing protein [Clostridia bacterium]|nr:SH3 domain-containing protein [Clostridia bacterium]